MILAQDVRNKEGDLVMSRGQVLTATAIELCKAIERPEGEETLDVMNTANSTNA